MVIARPARTATSLPWRSSMRTSALPTVPSPARPMRSGASITRRSLGCGWPAATDRRKPLIRVSRLPARGRHRDDVVQRLVSAFKETADVARCLAHTLLVFDQGDAHVILALLAEADARRHREVGLLDEQLREFERAERPELFRYRRPGE